jgi:hypothetical protein
MTKTEIGVQIQFENHAWGVRYDDGNNKQYGWVSLNEGKIYDPKYVKKPGDVESERNERLQEEVNKGKLIQVSRQTVITTK